MSSSFFSSNWRVKGNLLQGEVQHNCALTLSLQFKLQRSGSISVTYNLPTSFVFGRVNQILTESIGNILRSKNFSLDFIPM